MGTIETKVHQLEELSRQQKKVNEIKQDIADILGNADMEEKKKIAEQMSKMKYEDMNQARNLQFIVPNLVKELYDHEGPKGEFVIPKKNPEPIKKIEPTIEATAEPVIESTTEIKKEEKKSVVEPTIEKTKQKQKPTEKTEAIQKEDSKKEKAETEKTNEGSGRDFVVPGFELQKPKILSENEQKSQNIEKEIPVFIKENKIEKEIEKKTKEKKISNLKKILQKLTTKKTQHKSKEKLEEELEEKKVAIEKELKKRGIK